MKTKITEFKKVDTATNKRRVKLTVSETAFIKTVGLIMGYSSEVGWHGITKRKSGTSFMIEDLLVYPQVASAATVDTDQFEYEKWLYSQPSDVFNNIRMHGHSHYNFGVTPSIKDVEHRNGIVKQLVDDMFYIFMVWNKNLKIHFLLYDRKTGLIHDNRSIDLFVIIDGKSVSISDIRLNDITQRLENDEITKFLTDAEDMVKTRTSDKKTACSNSLRNEELYSLFHKFADRDIRLQTENPNGQDSFLLFTDDDGNEILRLFCKEKSVRFVWSADDVKSIRHDLTDDECMEVLNRVKSEYDMSMGVSWTTVEIHADSLYPKPDNAVMYGKFVRNEIANFIASEYDNNTEYVHAMMFGGEEVEIRIELIEDLDKKRLYHYWYGGHAAYISVSVNGNKVSGYISATGDIRAYLYDKDNIALCNIKDRSNTGDFYEMSSYIPNDIFLEMLLNHKDNEQGLSLQVEDNNWWEFYPSEENASSVVLNDYSLPDAIGEVAQILFKQITNEVKNESE